MATAVPVVAKKEQPTQQEQPGDDSANKAGDEHQASQQ